MDINWLINRIKNILVTPQTEWPVAGAEPHTVKDLYLKYIVIVAGVSAVAWFIENVILGTSAFGMTVRTPFGLGIVMAVLMYAMALATVFVVGVIADVLAPSFGGQRDQAQGVKLIAYAATAGWIGALLGIVPWIGWLLTIAAMIYGIYLVYLGAPHTTKVPADRAAGYTAIIVIIWLVISLVVGGAIGLMAASGSALSAISSSTSSSSSTEVEIDPNSALGKLEQFGKSMEEASKQMEAAEKSGDAKAQADAASKMLGTLMGGGKVVEAVGTDKLKPLAPESLAGLPRTSFAAEKSAAMGLQVSNVRAEYGEGERRINLEISDAGGASGIMGLASWAMVQTEREDASGYEKTYQADGNMVHEEWDAGSRRGQYSVIVAERFVVKLEADNVEMDELKAAIDELDLDALVAMKDEGVQQG
jgi:hypothetical protein